MLYQAWTQPDTPANCSERSRCCIEKLTCPTAQASGTRHSAIYKVMNMSTDQANYFYHTMNSFISSKSATPSVLMQTIHQKSNWSWLIMNITF